MNKYADYQAEIDDIIASGTKWVRFGGYWAGFEPSRGVYDAAYIARMDDAVNRLTSKGVNIVWLLGYTAPWASSAPTAPDAAYYKPANWVDWENYVTWVCSRYNNKVSYWEVWNEPDYPAFWKNNVGDYHMLLQKAATKIRQVNANNRVVLGGLALWNGTTQIYGPGTWFDSLLGMGAASSFDIVAYHAYGDSRHYFNMYSGMAQVMASHGISSRKIWITETGYTTVGTSSLESVKADRVDQTFLAHTALPGVERVFWYVNRNVPPFGNPSEENFGLYSGNRTPLKALAYYQAEGGALADFYLQKNYPAQAAALRTLYYVPAATGDGSLVTDYIPDGSVKRIPAGSYMYFRVDDDWIYDGNSGLDTSVSVDVTYLDTGTGIFHLQYDSQSSAYTGIAKSRAGSGVWTTANFTLPNVKFANRENNLSDFRLFAQGTDLIVSRVVLRRQMNLGRVILGTTQKFRLLEHSVDDDPTHIGYAPVATMGGEECRKLLGNSKYIALRVGDALAKVGDTQVTFGVRFWDSGTDNILIRYNAVGNDYKGLPITKTNTNTWRYVQIPITDAAFNNSQSYYADFTIGNGWDGTVEHISRVDVTARKISAALGGIEKFRLINQPLDANPANLGYAPWTTMGGTSCLQIQSGTKFLFFDVAPALVSVTSSNVTIGIRFWDAGTDYLQLRYNAIGNANKGVNIPKTNTTAWRYVQIALTDAAFDSLQSYYGDFSLGTYNDGSMEYISAVDVTVP